MSINVPNGDRLIVFLVQDIYCLQRVFVVGLGYWNYGFGHFIVLRASLYSASEGRLDRFTDPKVRAMALFGPRMEVLPGVFPAIADCHLGVQAGATLLAYCDRSLGLGLGKEMPSPGGLPARGRLSENRSLSSEEVAQV